MARLHLALLITLTVVFFGDNTEGLSCIPCGLSPCETPQCCDSGAYVKDVCGCCDVCAKKEGDVCGGPWTTSGLCKKGNSCFRSCDPCVTVETNRTCIFPFTYQGIEYNECTEVNSEAPWCALELDETGEVIPGKWEDCAPDCPGVEEICPLDLFNADGRCVPDSEREEIEVARSTQKSRFQFDDGASEHRAAPMCSERVSSKTCRCAADSPCQSKNFGPEPLKDGWCFLEHVNNPSSPTDECFRDATWSSSFGRFWSNEACTDKSLIENGQIPPPVGPPAPPPIDPRDPPILPPGVPPPPPPPPPIPPILEESDEEVDGIVFDNEDGEEEVKVIKEEPKEEDGDDE